MGIFTGNQRYEPMHYGEIYGVWESLGMMKGLKSLYQVRMNHAGDKELRDFLTEFLAVIDQGIRGTEAILMEQGVTPPPAPPERPAVNWQEIPDGARLRDNEIAFFAQVDVSGGMAAASAMAAKSIRADLRQLFLGMHEANQKLNDRIMKISKEKGWLIMPPLHLEHSEERNREPVGAV